MALDDIIEKIKQSNLIEEVIQETVALGRRRGRYLKGVEHDSLVVDMMEQCYFWNSKGENGDVFTWLEKRRGWDFKTAAEWLAKRAKLPEPEWGKQDNATRLATRANEDAMTIAARWMVKKLRGAATAVRYSRGRGWTDETIKLAGLGYSGNGSQDDRKDIAGDLDLNQVDRNNPIRKAVTGIPAEMLIYPHVRGGRVRYLSCRSIEGKRHYNLPVDLAGPRQIYYNHAYGVGEKAVVIVEGQADAVTLGQWGIAAVALAGTAWNDQRGAMDELVKRHDDLYLGLDEDKAGAKALMGNEDRWPVADVLGAMVRIVRWGTLIQGEKPEQVSELPKQEEIDAVPFDEEKGSDLDAGSMSEEELRELSKE